MIGQTSGTRSRVDALLARLATDPELRRQVLERPASALESDGLVGPATDEVTGYGRPPRCTETCPRSCFRSCGFTF